MNTWLKKTIAKNLIKKIFNNCQNRDVYGDFIVKTKEGQLAIKQSGDFLLYFDSDCTNEVRELVKARNIWDQFIEGNYKTAEPGLIFGQPCQIFSFKLC